MNLEEYVEYKNNVYNSGTILVSIHHIPFPDHDITVDYLEETYHLNITEPTVTFLDQRDAINLLYLNILTKNVLVAF